MLNRILCVHEHYDNAGKYAVCNYFIYHPVEAAGLAKEVRLFPYDSLKKLGIHGMIQDLLNEVKNYRPDIIIFMVPDQIYYPLGLALKYIRKNYGTQVIAFCGDLISGLILPERHRSYEFYTACSDALISVDSTCTKAIYDHPCHIQGHPTIDLRVFHPNPEVVKDIDVSFVGSVSANLYDSRREFLDYIKPGLAEKGYNLYTGGGQYYFMGEKSLSQADYVKIINRSKIVLNFSQTFAGFRQMKGRVLEAMACRSFVLTENCPNIGKFFEPGKDYIAFVNKEELLDKLLFYLEHEKEREQIAGSVYSKMTEIYTPKNVWGYIFKKLGFDLSTIEDTGFKKYEEKMNGIQNTLDISYPSLHDTDYLRHIIEKEQYHLAACLAIQRLTIFPLQAENWFYLGQSLYYAGQYGLAHQAFARSSFLDPLTEQVLPFTIDAFHLSQTPLVTNEMMCKLLALPARAVITAVVVARDNASTIQRCLKDLLEAVDKIVVVDIGSQDETKKIVTALGEVNDHIEFVEVKTNYYEEALLAGVQQSAGFGDEWILLIQPNEYLFPEDKALVRLGAGLFNGQNILLNILSLPVWPQGTGRTETVKYIVEHNRLFPKKSGIILNRFGAAFDEHIPMTNRTVKIRLHYDLANE